MATHSSILFFFFLRRDAGGASAARSDEVPQTLPLCSGVPHELHSSILAWETPWTEEPGGLQSLGSQKVRHDLATKQ